MVIFPSPSQMTVPVVTDGERVLGFGDLHTRGGCARNIDVPDAQFLTICNFTQEGGAQRGVVTVPANGQTNNVLAAVLIDQGPSVPPEFIKKVVIPGPAQVTVAPVPGTTLFVTYRRGLEPGSPSPTPTATPTATATPTPTVTP
jgi:hypothetical protein